MNCAGTADAQRERRGGWREGDGGGRHLDDEVDELGLDQVLQVRVGHQEGDVVARHGFSPQDDEPVGALHEEARELLREQRVHRVQLLDPQAARTHGTDVSAGRGERRDPVFADLMRQELMEGSMSVRSWSLRLITTGLSSASLVVGMVWPSTTASTSGLLYRSTCWQPKFSRQSAALSVARMQFR